MLIITRRTNESIFVGDDIVIINLGRNGNNVRFGIIAPEHTNIVRDEIAPSNHPLLTKIVDKLVSNRVKARRALDKVPCLKRK